MASFVSCNIFMSREILDVLSQIAHCPQHFSCSFLQVDKGESPLPKAKRNEISNQHVKLHQFDELFLGKQNQDHVSMYH